jgi:hypothetical protein
MNTAHRVTSRAQYRSILSNKLVCYTVILCDESAGDAYCEECAVKHADFDNELFISSGSDIDPESIYCSACGTDLSDYADA